MHRNVSVVCSHCGSAYEVSLERITCDCGGVLDLDFEPEGHEIEDVREFGLARYAAQLPVGLEELRRASLGLATTPMLEMTDGVSVKCDYISPSGSFKDRGAQVLVALALSLGAERVVLDSSGNAGAAMAAHCAHVGLACSVVVPVSAPAAKLSQSLAYGATVVAIDGDRAAATAAAKTMVDRPGTFYASHVENPLFLEGTKTWAFEVVEQIGDAPEEVVMSVGNGSLLLGAHRGFASLFSQGRTSKMPRMVAVQAKGWSPLSGDVAHGTSAPLADGIAILNPRRGEQIARVIASTGGEVRVVGEGEIVEATIGLARRGLWVEPTSGAAWAAASMASQGRPGPVVVSLGGAGFKSSPSPLRT